MSETRKIAAILVADIVGYSRLASADEDRTLSRLRGLRSDLIDPARALRSNDPTYVAQLEPIFEDMRKAEAPEE